MAEDPRKALLRLAEARGVSLAALSVMLGRNVAYLQQFVGRGAPRRLAEDDRHTLAAFFGVEDQMLGGPAGEGATVALPWLAVEAAAGAGADAGAERQLRPLQLATDTLTAAGIAARQASVITARGDSMMPTIFDGDRLVVDRDDRRVGRTGAIFVLRRDGDLLVKRVARSGDTLTIASDNPAYPAIAAPVAAIAVIGRVKLLLRGLA